MLAALARASLDGAVVVAVVWTIARLLRLSPGTRTVLWWCAGAKFVVGLWLSPIAVPVLPAPATTGTSGVAAQATDIRNPAARVPTRETGVSGPGNGSRWQTPDVGTSERGRTAWFSATGLAANADRWSAALLAAWFTGVLASAVIWLRRWRLTGAAIARSSPAPSGFQAMAAALAAEMRLRRVPELRLSDEVDTPLVTGLINPMVVLPAARFQQLPALHQRMAICHELAHLRRGDLWFGCAPALAERLFFFHPLVHLAAREYAFWREAACDAAVLRTVGAEPQEYGRLLLNLGVARPRIGLAAAGASWSFSNLKRRIVMLRDPLTLTSRSRLVAAGAIALAAAAVLPLQLAARPARGAAPVVASPPLETAATAQQSPARSERPSQKERDLNFVMFMDGDHTTMSGSMGDIERARRVRRRGEQLLWFRLGGREYVLRDPAVLGQVIALWKPVNELGDQQGKLGEKQGILGTKQGELGTRQGELGTEQGRLGTQQGRIGERQGALAGRERRAGDAQRDALDRERRELERDMRELDREMRALDVKMHELERPMRELGDQMDVLGKEMEVLGRQMEAASKRAEDEMRALLDRAVATGRAEPVK